MQQFLKSCPFCGYTKARIVRKRIGGSKYATPVQARFRFHVMCNKCRATGGTVTTKKMWADEYIAMRFGHDIYNKETLDKYIQKAIELWNARAESEDDLCQ